MYSWTVGTGEVEPSRSLSLSKRPIRLQINTLANYFVTNDGKKLSLWEPVYMTKQAELKVHGITTVTAGCIYITCPYVTVCAGSFVW